MMGEFYENGIQGMAYETSDARVACDLDDPQVRTVGFRVDMPEGMVEGDMNVDRLGCWPPEEGQKEFDLAVKAAKLFVAAPELLAALEEILEGNRNGWIARVAREAIAKAKGGE